jgi:hypothetical protein
MKFSSLQEYFDQAVAFFSAMPRRSMDGDKCSYFVPATQDACIIGQFMNDNQREVFADYGGNVQGLVHQFPALAEDLIYGYETLQYGEDGSPLHAHPGFDLACELQRVHDQQGSWDQDGFIAWYRLAQLAIDFDLNFSMPQVPEESPIGIKN